LAQNVLPLFSSLVVHAAVIAVGIATAGVVVRQARVLHEEQVGAVSSEFQAGMSGNDIARLANAAKGMPLELTRSVDADAAADMRDMTKGDSLAGRLGSAGGGGDGEAPALVIGLGSSGFGSGGGSGGGRGKGHGTGEGDGTGSAGFGLPAGSGYGSGGGLFISNRGARRVVFVCDATGTMINRFALLRMELARAIGQLQPVQSYNVVFFRDRDAAAANKDGLLLANNDNRRKTRQFLEEFSPSGQTNPLPALKLAFAQKPELVYFLTDGEFNNLVSYQEVVAEIARLNPGRKVRVNTISFGSHDAEAEEVLKRIAQENGGMYKHVAEEDLTQ
jgi:hypothetical protein